MILFNNAELNLIVCTPNNALKENYSPTLAQRDYKSMLDRVQTSSPDNRGFSRNTTNPFNCIERIMGYRETLKTNNSIITTLGSMYTF